jgi:predicted HAD superfamily Cof-like phosphohydrolase
MSNFDLVRDFHKKMGAPIRREPQANIPEAKLRFAFIEEELNEYKQAIADQNVIAVADALADLLYVVYGTALHHGIDIDAIFREVHRSNMTKEPNAEGKAIKGIAFENPQISDVLAKQPGHRYGAGW